MGKRHLTPLATALGIADQLSQADQLTLIDYLRSKQPKPPKPAAPVAKKSSRRGRQQAPAANIETETAIASTAGGNANGSDAASA